MWFLFFTGTIVLDTVKDELDIYIISSTSMKLKTNRDIFLAHLAKTIFN